MGGLNQEETTGFCRSTWMEHRVSDMLNPSCARLWRFRSQPPGSSYSSASALRGPRLIPLRRGPSGDQWSNPSWTRILARFVICSATARTERRLCTTTSKGFRLYDLVLDGPSELTRSLVLDEESGLVFNPLILYLKQGFTFDIG